MNDQIHNNQNFVDFFFISFAFVDFFFFFLDLKCSNCVALLIEHVIPVWYLRLVLILCQFI